jgi:NitT/TauT family transport system ATP-binding protein
VAVSGLALDDVGIRYDSDGGQSVQAVLGVSFEIPQGEFVALVGRSGCGKTSLLYAIDGLLPITSGEIRVGGRRVEGPGRDRALVFQSPTLFPWYDVLGNVKYGAANPRSKEARAQAEELVRLVGLEGFERHHPHQLSGGMQQRVNLARALAVDPDVMLLDEPFSALDAQTRETMQTELLRIWRARNEAGRRMTMVFVTHDITEAVYLADRVIVFMPRPGRVREEVRIDLPRPRELAVKRSAEFHGYADHVAALLEEEHS